MHNITHKEKLEGDNEKCFFNINGICCCSMSQNRGVECNNDIAQNCTHYKVEMQTRALHGGPWQTRPTPKNSKSVDLTNP
jgi:hypothetical protein